MSETKIDMGEVFVTIGINAKMDKSEPFSRDVVLSLHKFESGEWGDTSEEDALLNDRSVQDGTMDIMGAYETTVNNECPEVLSLYHKAEEPYMEEDMYLSKPWDELSEEMAHLHAVMFQAMKREGAIK